MTEAVTDLPGQASVAQEYQHRPKLATPAEALALPTSYLKWYDISLPETGVPATVQAQAREHLRAQVATGSLAIDDELGFALLHRCGQSFYFLIVSTWRNENELWETVYAKNGDDAEFEPVPYGTHRPTYCVWELGAVCHERLAWTRYLMSARDPQARHAYAADLLEGPV